MGRETWLAALVLCFCAEDAIGRSSGHIPQIKSGTRSLSQMFAPRTNKTKSDPTAVWKLKTAWSSQSSLSPHGCSPKVASNKTTGYAEAKKQGRETDEEIKCSKVKDRANNETLDSNGSIENGDENILDEKNSLGEKASGIDSSIDPESQQTVPTAAPSSQLVAQNATWLEGALRHEFIGCQSHHGMEKGFEDRSTDKVTVEYSYILETSENMETELAEVILRLENIMLFDVARELLNCKDAAGIDNSTNEEVVLRQFSPSSNGMMKIEQNDVLEAQNRQLVVAVSNKPYDALFQGSSCTPLAESSKCSHILGRTTVFVQRLSTETEQQNVARRVLAAIEKTMNSGQYDAGRALRYVQRVEFGSAITSTVYNSGKIKLLPRDNKDDGVSIVATALVAVGCSALTLLILFISIRGCRHPQNTSSTSDKGGKVSLSMCHAHKTLDFSSLGTSADSSTEKNQTQSAHEIVPYRGNGHNTVHQSLANVSQDRTQTTLEPRESENKLIPVSSDGNVECNRADQSVMGDKEVGSPDTVWV